MISYLLLVSLSLTILHVILRYNKWGRAINNIPGLKPLPLLGNMLSFNVSQEKTWLLVRQLAKEYYPTFKVWFTSSALVFIRHPDDIKILLSSEKYIKKSSFYDTLSMGLGDGIVVSYGEKWYKRRRILNSAFCPTLVENHLKISNNYVQKLITNLNSQGDETVENLLQLCSKLELEIICESAMAVDISKTESEGGEKYRNAMEIISHMVLYRSVRPYIKNWMLRWLPLGQKLYRSIKEVGTFRNKVIRERQKYLERTKFTMNNTADSDENYDTEYDGNRKKPILDILLSAENQGMIDRQGVAAEVDNFIAAGFDTTSLALCYTLLLLAENKEAQNLARAEVFQVFDQSNGNVSISDIHKLQYLDLCFKESLRLFPPISLIGRYLTEDLQLVSDDIVIPAKTEVIVGIFDVHRDPNFWPEPEKFNPNRFLPEEIKKQHPFAYLPFSMGLRNCIGQKYAIMSVKSAVANILYNFYLEPINRTCSLRSFPISVALYPGRPMHVKFIKIKK